MVVNKVSVDGNKATETELEQLRFLPQIRIVFIEGTVVPNALFDHVTVPPAPAFHNQLDGSFGW